MVIFVIRQLFKMVLPTSILKSFALTSIPPTIKVFAREAESFWPTEKEFRFIETNVNKLAAQRGIA